MSISEQSVSLMMTAASSASVACSALVVLSFLRFEELQRLRFIELVFYVMLNTMVASIGTALGVVKSGSAACWFQGLATNINFLSSALWTMTIAYQLTHIQRKGRVIEDLSYFHVLNWGLPIAAALLPLTTNTYSQINGWCFIGERSGSPAWGLLVWALLSFYLWQWLCILVTIYLLVVTYITSRDAMIHSIFRSSINKLACYPLVYLLCWIPASLSDFQRRSENGRYTSDAVTVIGTLLPCLQGVFLTVLFFSQNPIARDLCVKHMLSSCCSAPTGAAGDDAINVTYHEYELDYNSERATFSSLLRGSTSLLRHSKSTLQAALRPSMVSYPASGTSQNPLSMPGRPSINSNPAPARLLSNLMSPHPGASDGAPGMLMTQRSQQHMDLVL